MNVAFPVWFTVRVEPESVSGATLGDGLGDGATDGDGLATGDGLADGLTDGDGLGDAAADALALGLGDAAADALALGLGDAAADALALGLGEVVGDAEADALGEGDASGEPAYTQKYTAAPAARPIDGVNVTALNEIVSPLEDDASVPGPAIVTQSVPL